MGWFEYSAAFVVFFLTHSIPVRPPVRARLLAMFGRRGFTIGYSALSLAALTWVIGATSRAPFVPLWGWAPWHSHLVLTVMGLVCAILALAIGRPNPFSFGGARNDQFDPTDPGIVRFTRHPLLLALALWAFAHMLVNGDLAHVVMFAIFGGFAVLGRWIIDRRKKRQMGADWDTTLSDVRASGIRLDARSVSNLGLRLGLGVLLYAGLIWIHPVLFGVSPLS